MISGFTPGAPQTSKPQSPTAKVPKRAIHGFALMLLLMSGNWTRGLAPALTVVVAVKVEATQHLAIKSSIRSMGSCQTEIKQTLQGPPAVAQKGLNPLSSRARGVL